MRNNKAILDEAARSVRRTFVGSVAGSIGMLAVVGAAGAYGMPEKLTAQALAAAMAKFNVKFPEDGARCASARRPCRSPTAQAAGGNRRRAGRRDVAPCTGRRRVAPPTVPLRSRTSVVAKTLPVIQAAPGRNPFTATIQSPRRR